MTVRITAQTYMSLVNDIDPVPPESCDILGRIAIFLLLKE